MLIARLFHIRYTLRGTSYLLHRLGYARRFPSTAERDEKADRRVEDHDLVKLRG